MINQFSRTELLVGREAMNTLQNARVAVFGVGGVGGYTGTEGTFRQTENRFRRRPDASVQKTPQERLQEL